MNEELKNTWPSPRMEEFVITHGYWFACSLEHEQEAQEAVKRGMLQPLSNLADKNHSRFYVPASITKKEQLPSHFLDRMENQFFNKAKEPFSKGDIATVRVCVHESEYTHPFEIIVRLTSSLKTKRDGTWIYEAVPLCSNHVFFVEHDSLEKCNIR